MLRALTLWAMLGSAMGLALLLIAQASSVSNTWRASMLGFASAQSLAGTLPGLSPRRREDDEAAWNASGGVEGAFDRSQAPVAVALDARHGWARPSLFGAPLRAVNSSMRAAVANERFGRAKGGHADEKQGGAADATRPATDVQSRAREPHPLQTQRLRRQPLRLLHWNILEGAAGKLPVGWGGAAPDSPPATRLEGIVAFIRRGGNRKHNDDSAMNAGGNSRAGGRSIDGDSHGGYDVVTCNELNGFHQADWQALGTRAGLPHAHLLSHSQYRIGVLSRHPFRVVAERRGPPFAHGLLCIRLLGSGRGGGLEVCVTHLDPHASRMRAREAAEIAAHVGESSGPLVLLGDLNTLSPIDRHSHAAQGLARRMRTGTRSGQLSRKFLTSEPPSAAEAPAVAADAAVDAHDGTGEPAGDGLSTVSKGRLRIDYSPMQTLLDAPLVDLGARTHAGAYTVPTRVNADHMHFMQMRLDYCLISADLSASCRAAEPPVAPHGNVTRGGCWAHAVVTEETEQLSDHFPLDVQLVVPQPGTSQALESDGTH